MKKIAAVVNDSIGKVWAVGVGYRFICPGAPISAKDFKVVRNYGEIGEYEVINIYFDGLKHTVDTHNYSIVYSEE